ncbi:MAG: hypothetical protein H7321_04195 [Bacteroidia bacterium]|nr:hypothetical protein [Bacteroidia bacterium]
MKVKFLIILTALIFTLPAIQAQKPDILRLSMQSPVRKPVANYPYACEGTECRRKLFMYSDSTFMLESGCIDTAVISMGTWRKVKGNLVLKSIPKSKINLIRNIELSGGISKGKVDFSFREKTGITFTNIDIKGYYKDTIQGISKDSVVFFTSGYTDYRISVDCSKFDSLEFYGFTLFTGKSYKFSVANLTEKVHIVMNINPSYVFDKNLSYQYFIEPKIYDTDCRN